MWQSAFSYQILFGLAIKVFFSDDLDPEESCKIADICVILETNS